MAVIIDKSPARVEPTANRMVREARLAGRDVIQVNLSEEDILFYLDEEICQESAPRFPGWHQARTAAGKAKKWKKWVAEEYGLNLTPRTYGNLPQNAKDKAAYPQNWSRKFTS